MDRLISESTFREHPFAKQAIQEAANTILNERFYSTSDQVENCIKPYKFEIEVDDREWAQSRENSQSLLKGELKACEEALKLLKGNIGTKKLGQVMSFVDKIRQGEHADMKEGTEAFGFSQPLLQKGECSRWALSRLVANIMRCNREGGGVFKRQSGNSQNASIFSQGQAVRELSEQISLPRDIPGRRGREANVNRGIVPERGITFGILLQCM
jgi:hypothetical protein